MALASWEQDWADENAARAASKERKRAGYRAMSPRRAVIAELKNELPGKLHHRFMYARNAPALLNYRQERTLKNMLKHNKIQRGRTAVANVLAGRRLNRIVPVGRPNVETVKAMRLLSKGGIRGLPENIQDQIAEMLHGATRRGQLPIMERMARSRRGRSVTRRVNEARARRVAEYERREKELRHLGPKREHVSKTRSVGRSRSKSRSTRRTRSRARSH